LSDNQISSLSNFPLLKRLRTIFCNNNHLLHVGAGIGKALPGLEVLILCNNELSTLADIAPLGELNRLTHLALNNNPVTSVQNYRAFLIHKIPTLEALDFTRVKRKERYLANKFFTSSEGKQVLASMLNPAGSSGSGGAGPTKRQKMEAAANEEAERVRVRIRNAILKAESIDDLNKLQAALRSQNHTEEFLAQLETMEQDIARQGK
jgi:U2 small nuclear ribonucleoprotein A'